MRKEYLTDPRVFRVNRLDSHSDHIHKLVDDKAESSFYQRLDGIWECIYSKSLDEIEPDFYKDGFTSNRFQQIRVPGHAQLQGFGTPSYNNTLYPWDGKEAIRPPFIPHENDIIQYVKHFDLTQEQIGKRVILRFEGVETGLFVYLNGHEVGYSEDSFTPSEFDITRYVREKDNLLALEVVQRTKASYIEDQDFFRFSGIFRSVYVYSIPSCHIFDFHSRCDYKKDGSGSFDLKCKLSLFDNREYKISYSLYDKDRLILTDSITTNNDKVTFASRRIDSVHPYSYKDPYLYDLTLEVKDGNNILEVVNYKLGFNHIEIVKNQLHYNYERLMICGINRHEWSPYNGRVISESEMDEDIKLIKKVRANAIRTSHYPNRARWYDKCDQNGILLLSECNLESHGSWQKLGKVEPSWNVPGSLDEWREIVLDRAISNFELFKNHASIFMWSLGNESYCLDNIKYMYEYYKSVDFRPVHYEGVFHNPKYRACVSDVESQMYTSVKDCKAFMDNDSSKPFMLCEFMHCMGNSLGGFISYDKLFDEYEGFLGGFVWDFIDQTLLLKYENGDEYLAYGADSGERNSDYEFSANGIVTSLREEKAEFEEVRSIYARRIW